MAFGTGPKEMYKFSQDQISYEVEFPLEIDF
jgi:hypothetical protein